MVLSIGMIVKNEEKYLEQCLTALQPILDQLDSELIIADTGSTDRTVEIARKFTDNVFHFEWISDFAAARNSTLERAKGDWYMFIDADEIAVDCSELIRFFRSGEYRKYYSATYIQKSYTDVSDKDHFNELRAMRMIQKDPESRFKGRIHETFTYIKRPTKHLAFTVDHYGYCFTDNGVVTELAIEKNKRNLEGLFKELEDENILERNSSVYSEIADCYYIIKDYEKGLEYIERGLNELPHDHVSISQYYIKKIAGLNSGTNYEEIIAVGNEYFDKEKNPWHNKAFANDCFVYLCRGYALYKIKNYRAAIQDFVSGFDIYRKYNQNKLITDDLMYATFRVNITLIKAAYDIFFRCCFQEKQFELANEYVRAIPLEKYFGDQNFMVNHLNIRVEMMEKLGYNDLDRLYRQLDDFGKEFLLTAVRRKVHLTTAENREVIIKKLASLEGTSSEIADIYKGYFDNAPDFGLIKSFLEKHGSENSDHILYILLENQMDITPFLLTEDFFADRAVQILTNFFQNGIEMYENYDIENIPCTSPEALERATSMFGYAMLRAMEKGYKISGLFEKYGDLGLKWFNAFGEGTEIPGDIRAALFVNDVVSAKKVGDKTQFVNAVRVLKSRVSDLIPLVDTYEKENQDAFRKARVNPEFEKLAVQVKSNIRALIADGSIGEARKLIKEFEVICPDDSDIETLKDEINNSLQ